MNDNWTFGILTENTVLRLRLQHAANKAVKDVLEIVGKSIFLGPARYRNWLTRGRIPGGVDASAARNLDPTIAPPPAGEGATS